MSLLSRMQCTHLIPPLLLSRPLLVSWPAYGGELQQRHHYGALYKARDSIRRTQKNISSSSTLNGFLTLQITKTC